MEAITSQISINSLFYSLKNLIDNKKVDNKYLDLIKRYYNLNNNKIVEEIINFTSKILEPKSYNNSPENKSDELKSIFNFLGNCDVNKSYKIKKLDYKINYPQSDEKSNFIKNVEELLNSFFKETENVEVSDKFFNLLMDILEEHFSYVYAVAEKYDIKEISLFDYSKIMAAMSSSIYEYMKFAHESNTVIDLSDPIKINTIKTNKTFLIFTCGFSGIQNYIYNVITEDALKSLRSRSFFIELFLEHISDEIVENCGVSRANLVYSGGGHCYILLPNTENVIRELERVEIKLNEWLIKNFGTSIYFSGEYMECSINELFDNNSNERIFRNLDEKAKDKKLHKYNVNQIKTLNNMYKGDNTVECKICGSEHTVNHNDKHEIETCYWCHNFSKISKDLLESRYIFISREKDINSNSIKLPTVGEDVYAYFSKEILDNTYNNNKYIRAYSKNFISNGLEYCKQINMGDYVFNTEIAKIIEATELQRIAVLRADVDNLGLAFTTGYTKTTIGQSINSILIKASFSRQLTLFFKHHINSILSEIDGNEKNRIITVYSGGDDLFLLGNLKDTISVALKIQSAFNKFTNGSLTLSCGIGIYPIKYPLYKSAAETAVLEDCSKENPDKNSITLFDNSKNNTYDWSEFEKRVIKEKLKTLKDFFDYEKFDDTCGISYLHRLLVFLNDSSDKINIARYAYLLARLEPSKNDREYYDKYKDFSKKMYLWIRNKKDKQQLITAINIYLYYIRKGSKNNELA